MKNILVFYHAECRDGFGAAWAVWKKLGNKAEYIPAVYKIIPDFSKIKNKIIYFVDFCYEREIMDKIIKLSKNVIVIDHHESRKDFIKSLKGSVYGEKNSGTVLAWKYFHPKKEIPIFLKYIEANDLWNFSLPGTLEAGLFIDSQKTDFKVWDKLAKDFENKNKRKDFMGKGKMLLDYENKIIDEILKESYQVIFEKKKIWVANSQHKFSSVVANILAKKGNGLGIAWRQNKNFLEFSLRSDGRVNTIRFAQKYGGGGHKNASGFKISADKPFPWKIVKDEKKKEA